MSHLTFSSVTKWAFWIVLLLLLLPIWTNAYFLTGDGPNHLYNAKVWWDMMQREHYQFYRQYVYLSEHLEPNYFGHFVMGLLSRFLSPFLAEKILLSGYILLFPISFRLVLRQIRPENDWLVFLAFPFVYNHVFQMGFYNFSYSMVFGMLMLGYWLRWRENFTDLRKLGFAMLALLCVFSHPVGLLVALSAIGLVFFPYNLPEKKEIPQRILQVLLPLIPVLVVMGGFFYRKMGSNNYGKEPFESLLNDFTKLTALQALNMNERPVAQGVAILFGILLLVALAQRLRRFSWQKTDAFFLVFLFWLLLYLNLPGTVAGGGITGRRIQFIPYLLMLFWLVTLNWQRYLRWGLTGIGIVITLTLLILRFPTYQKLSAAVAEIRSAAPYIESEKTVLNLTYSFNGKAPNGALLANAIHSFIHAADYVAVDRAVMMMPNYEAGTYNFPLIWRWQVEPFSQIGNLEAAPPQANFIDFAKRTGGQIDYVITLWMDEQWKDHPDYQNVTNQLNQGYNLIFTSPQEMVRLYRRKDF